MKKYLNIVLMAFTTSLAAANINVVASTSDLAEFTRIVGGDKVTVDYIVRGTQNPHFIEVKPSYMLKLRSADAFVMLGMQLELWSQQIIDGSRNSNILIVDCSKKIDKMEVPSFKVDASYGDVHPFGNPHYWLDPQNVKVILSEIVDGLATVSPSDRDYFQRNADAYAKELDSNMPAWKKMADAIRGAKIVTYHSSFSYFAHRFGLDVVGYVEPKPGIPPTPTHTSELIQMMRHNGVKVIGLEQFYEENVPERIAMATGAKVVKLSTSVGGLDGADTYIHLITYDLHALQEALK